MDRACLPGSFYDDINLEIRLTAESQSTIIRVIRVRANSI